MSDIVTAHLPEQPVPGKPLGRHVEHDPASWGFQASGAGRLKSVMHAMTGLPLDQDKPKPWGSCTANALCGAANTAPNAAKLKNGAFTEKGAFYLYQQETKNEGYTTPPDDPGGTGLEVCKAAKQLGWIKSYRHAFGIDHALSALVLRPVITGVAWMDSFDNPDENGLVNISVDAQVRGGHEIVAVGLDVPNSLVWLMNSWGPGWGKGGMFCWSFETWDALLKQQGDCTVPLA